MKIEQEIIYNGVKLLVEGTYTPAEEQVMYYPDGSGFPGASPEIDINAIFVGDVDIYDLLSFDVIDKIGELVIEEIESSF